MSILLYARDRHDVSGPVADALADLLFLHGVWPCGSTATLKEALHVHGGRFSLAILVATSAEELGELLALQPLVAHLRLILIVPGGDPGLVELGHRLRPRFLTTLDDLAHLTPVTQKMLQVTEADLPERKGGE